MRAIDAYKGQPGHQYSMSELRVICDAHKVKLETLIIREYFDPHGYYAGKVVFTTEQRITPANRRKKLAEGEDDLTVLDHIGKGFIQPHYRQYKIELGIVSEPLSFYQFQTEVLLHLTTKSSLMAGFLPENVLYSKEEKNSYDGYPFKAEPFYLSTREDKKRGFVKGRFEILYNYDKEFNRHEWRIHSCIAGDNFKKTKHHDRLAEAMSEFGI